MEVYVSAVTTPNQFWIQVVGTGTLALDELVKEMTSYYENQENQEMHNLKDVSIIKMITKIIVMLYTS